MRTRFERFCFRHRDKGIPNLMLYIVIISAVVYIASLLNRSGEIYSWLSFDKAKILQGQVWRLFSFVFTYTPGSNPFMILIGFYFFYHLARHLELIMGTFKFNLYYFSGVVLMVAFAMIFCPTEPVLVGRYLYDVGLSVYANMAWYMHLTLLLAFAAACPDSQFLVFFFIPVKAWFLGIVYLLLIGIDIYTLAPLFPHNLFPLAAIANFLLFAGKDALNLLPEAIRPNMNRAARQWKKKAAPKRPIHFEQNDPKVRAKVPYTHRCVICGRTDVSDPGLEFRYCSRCNGYFCYCEDHISNHTHVE